MIRLLRILIPASILALIVLDFVVAMACLLVFTALLMGPEAELFIFYEDGFARLSFVALGIVVAFYFQNLYENVRIRSKSELLLQAVAAVGVALLMQSMIGYLFPGWIAPRYVLLCGSILFCLIFPLWRIAFVRFFIPAMGSESVLFFGANSLSQEIAASLPAKPQIALRGIGFLADDHEPGEVLQGLKVLGRLSDFSAVVKQVNPDRIVVGLIERRAKLPLEELLRLRLSGVRIEEAATTYQLAFSRIPTRGLVHSQLIFSSELGPLPRNLRLQTFYSVILALIGVTITAPVMLLVALAVRLTSSGPVLFRQTRIGMGGHPFTIYKFRSMVVDAEADTGAVWASRNDPRVTAVGGVLRKMRLDELPQLFNVLRREMSIVGPRPERPEFVQTLSELIPFYAHRHSVKPGITGWAQINYKYGETVEDAVIKLEYDMYYIKNLSPALDLYTMFHTIKAMLASGHGQ